MQIGTLIAELFVSAARLPIRGATVFVSNESDTELIGVRRTNESGRTAPIPIEAPESSLTLHPTPPAVQPFTQVNVYTQLAGYYNMLIRGVQIFGGQESIQPIQLVPLPENFQGENTEIIDITPQDL